ncbi:hypothetical protein [Kineococcus glutinatus]|uniref:Uncharacterized protein n=1 Tax=Kineococcus glutinatus TaxID=1070872 RepID=A0ABP9HXS3_9ACTN
MSDADADPGAGGDGPEVVLGLVAAPGAAGDLAAGLVEDVRAGLAERFAGVGWRVELVQDGLVAPPAGDRELVEAARALLLERGWDLVVCLTDLPLQVARRPVVAHASPLHSVAVVSVPALGALALHRHARAAVLTLVGRLLDGVPGAGEDERSRTARRARTTRRLRELGIDADPRAEGVRFGARVLRGNVRLLAGMVRTNRPWRLAAHLSRALVAAVTTGVFALITPDVWRLADSLGAWRLSVVALASVAAIVVTLLVGAGLWERAHHRGVREQVALFNIATTVTVLIGVLALYGALFALSLAAALLLVVPSLLAEGLGHPVGFADHLQLVWLTSSLATVGGALGAGLEADETVRQAAYAYRSDGSAEDLVGERPPSAGSAA